MTKDKIMKKLQFLYEADSHKEMQMFGFKKNNSQPYKINIDGSLEQEIIAVMAEGLKESLIDSDYQIVDYSKADERKGRYYRYDVQEIPDAFKAMADVIGKSDAKKYDFSNDGVGAIDHFIMVISDGDKPFSIYKSFSNVEKIMKSKKSTLALMSKEILKSYDKPLLRIGSSFQVIFFPKNEYIILDDKFAENSFGLHQILKNQATKLIKALDDKKLLPNIKKIEKYNEKISFSRKLVKVLSTSKVLQDIEKDKILDFVKNDPKLKDELRIIKQKGNEYFEVKNTQSAKALLDLLNDEFVYSELTKQRYQAPAKDPYE